MFDDSGTKYYGQQLWSHQDHAISTNHLSVENLVIRDSRNSAILRIKMWIKNIKSHVSEGVTLNYQNVVSLLNAFKKINASATEWAKAVEANRDEQFTVSYQAKKKIFATFLYRVEYNGPCIRLIITDRTEGFLDSEKVYVSWADFVSLEKLLSEIRDRYVLMCSSLPQFVTLQEIKESIEGLDSRMQSYYSELKDKLLSQNTMPLHQIEEHDPLGSSPDTPISHQVEENKPSSSSGDFHEVQMHEDLSKYITENKTSIIIEDLPSEPVKKTPTIPAGFDKKLVEDVLSNDICNLEMIVLNCVNDDLPFQKIASILKERLGFDLYEGVNKNEIAAANFVISSTLKYYVNDCIVNHKKIPGNVMPIFFADVKSNEKSLSLMYDLLLSFSYFNSLKNLLQDKEGSPTANKQLMVFALKSLLSSFVCSMLPNTNEQLLVAEVTNRFNYYTSNGVMSKLEDTIKSSFGSFPTISLTSVIDESKRLLSATLAYKSKWGLKETFDKFLKERVIFTPLETFLKFQIGDEQIKKIIDLTFNYKKNSKVVRGELGHQDLSDLPQDVLKVFDLGEKVYTTDNLKRIIKDFVKDDSILKSCIEISNSVNTSFKDIVNMTIDFTKVPENVLKAIYLWDCKKDPRIATDYNYYDSLIKSCNLTKDQIMSIMINPVTKIDTTFSDSFMAARDDL